MNDDDFSDTDSINVEIPDDISERNVEIEWKAENKGIYKKLFGKDPRESTDKPQPSTGFGNSRFGIRPDRIFPTRRGKPLPLRYRKDNEDLYRYDIRPYETIFLEGFRPWNNKAPRSLRHYQRFHQQTAFISTTRAEKMPTIQRQMLPDGTTHRYVIKAPGGIDFVATLKNAAFPAQQEVVFWKGIRPEFIDRVEVVNQEGRTLKVVTRRDWEETVDKEARRLLADAVSAEPRITEHISYVFGAAVKGGRLRGFQYRIKTEDSLKRKLKRRMKENPGRSPSWAANSIVDTIRYTVELRTEDYSKNVARAVQELRTKGFTLTDQNNLWGQSDSIGIYSIWHNRKAGMYFEIQFHTGWSYDAEKAAYELYEEARRPGITAAELAANRKALQKIFGRVSIPPDVVGLRL
ncbi:hypothetical protein ACFVFJ_49190 [Streptomyces sp. NPDC057717]|uniref:scabin-related ADP-ribosyltransferase n=1 Tax=Streptomyces sp. NPDC057717 TaxID=3346224 RepID=UPI0036C7C297